MNDVPNEEWLSAYLDGELSDGERAQVDGWLAADPSARQRLDDLRAIRAAIQDLPRESLAADFSSHVLAEAQARAGEASTADVSLAPAKPASVWRDLSWRGMFNRRAFFWSGLAVAIALVIRLSEPPANRQIAHHEVVSREPAEAPRPAAPIDRLTEREARQEEQQEGPAFSADRSAARDLVLSAKPAQAPALVPAGTGPQSDQKKAPTVLWETGARKGPQSASGNVQGNLGKVALQENAPVSVLSAPALPAPDSRAPAVEVSPQTTPPEKLALRRFAAAAAASAPKQTTAPPSLHGAAEPASSGTRPSKPAALPSNAQASTAAPQGSAASGTARYYSPAMPPSNAQAGTGGEASKNTLDAATAPATAPHATVWAAPAGEELSPDFTVTVEGQPSPVYVVRVASGDRVRRWKAMDDKAHSGDYYEKAAFTTFDMRGPVRVTITCPRPIHSARVLPSVPAIVPEVRGNRLTLTMTEPRPLTVEIDGDWVHSLHLLANPPETNAPRPGDPKVIYFGPGIHEISHMEVGDGQTVYLAPGAVVRGVVRPDEPFAISGYSGLRTYRPTFVLHGKGITFRGRGILDGAHCPPHARNLLVLEGSDIRVEGVILRDSSTWNMPIRRSDRVRVENVKIFGYRANSDGIDICNSRDVLVERCFLRTLDDLVVVKTDRGQGETRHVVVRGCVLWNEVAHALSIGAELRENVEDVLFTDCDVIHDKGREWTLRVYHCDSARVSNVRFSKLRIEESPRLISLWINKASWTRDKQRGHIQGVTFEDIAAVAAPVQIQFSGFDATHAVENVTLRNVVINGKRLTTADVHTNAFVRNVTVEP